MQFTQLEQERNQAILISILGLGVLYLLIWQIRKRLKGPLYRVREIYNYDLERDEEFMIMGFIVEKRKGLIYYQYGIIYETHAQAQGFIDILTKPIIIDY